MGKSIKERDKTHRKPRNNKSNNLIQKYNTIGEQSATEMMAKTEVDYNGNHWIVFKTKNSTIAKRQTNIETTDCLQNRTQLRIIPLRTPQNYPPIVPHIYPTISLSQA